MLLAIIDNPRKDVSMLVPAQVHIAASEHPFQAPGYPQQLPA
jgi:hypothetical protein